MTSRTHPSSKDRSNRRVSELEQEIARLTQDRFMLETGQRIAHVASWEWTPSTNTFKWSRYFYDMLELPEEEPPSLQLFLKRLHLEDRDTMDARMAAAARDGLARTTDLRVVLPRGDTRTIRFESEPMRQGEQLSFVGTATDVTERLATERRLEQRQRMDAVGRLASGVAHDFNNLVTIILANVDLLRMNVQPAQALEDISVAAQAAAELTTRLLDFSRQSTIETTMADIGNILEEFGPVVVRSLGEAIRTHLEVGAGSHPVEVDPSQVRRLFLNLVLNARDAMPNGGTLSIRVHRERLERDEVEALSAGEYAVVEVSDTGHGMSAATSRRAFEPFFTTKAGGRGTGLGLASAYGTMKQAGGAITLESALGTGTTFRLFFPIVDSSQRSGLRVRQKTATLLVEDDDAVRKVVGQILRSCGHVVLSARDGAEALELWRENKDRIDLLVSDVSMAGLQGPELAAQLAAEHPGLQVLLLTGYRDVRTEDLPPGTRLLHKPFKVSDIVGIVEAMTADSQRSMIIG